MAVCFVESLVAIIIFAFGLIVSALIGGAVYIYLPKPDALPFVELELLTDTKVLCYICIALGSILFILVIIRVAWKRFLQMRNFKKMIIEKTEEQNSELIEEDHVECETQKDEERVDQQCNDKLQRETRLVDAVRNDDQFAMTELLKTGDGLDKIDGFNLLHLVALHDRYKLVAPLYALCDYEILYIMKVGPQAQQFRGMTAHEIANMLQHWSTSRMIETHYTFTQRLSQLHVAARKGDLQSINALYEQTGNVDFTGEYGNTPLYTACVSGKLEAVKLLLEHGADIAKLNDWGDTLLHRAARWGQYNVVKFLLGTTLKWDINRKNNEGMTALHMAVLCGSAPVVRLLLQNKARADIIDVRRKRPLDTAIENGQGEIVQILGGL
ncbi:ankyrin repeat and SOCS box protein 2-like [Ptychodera flava]|uniref:ankyrin repeat and SOCS box protein 2-like n=1 Tax=Ptychodera flava TaxID=63121 RepID=UPI00396A58AE